MASKLNPNVLYVTEPGETLRSPQADSERTVSTIVTLKLQTWDGKNLLILSYWKKHSFLLFAPNNEQKFGCIYTYV